MFLLSSAIYQISVLGNLEKSGLADSSLDIQSAWLLMQVGPRVQVGKSDSYLAICRNSLLLSSLPPICAFSSRPCCENLALFSYFWAPVL